MIDIVKISQQAENEFVGVNCGIMDQFAVGMGREDQAMLLNCDTLEYEYAPLKLDGYKIVIANTNKQRGLAESKYNERRSECDRALVALKKHLEQKENPELPNTIQYLCDLTPEIFENIKDVIEIETDCHRAEHAVYENARVKEAVKALNNGDLIKFGGLINLSHDSLRDLYDVTGYELDTMVDEARKIDGVIGSRMTGAGFGGCTISIVEEKFVKYFIKTVGEAYEQKTQIEPEFYVAGVGQGSHEVKGDL
jgi:galactokinase